MLLCFEQSKCDLPLNLTQLRDEIDKLDAHMPKADFHLQQFATWLHDDFKMLTGGEARRIVDSTKDDQGSGILAWAKLKQRYWSREQRGLIQMPGSIMAFTRPMELKHTFAAKMDITELIREWERVAGEQSNIGMTKSALSRSLP